MARTFLTPIDLNKNEMRNMRIQNLSTSPSSPVTGQMYYDTDDNILYWWNNSSWVSASGGAGGIPGTIFDAKGDLITASAADTPVRLPVGSDGEFLVAASGESSGLDWRAIQDSDLPSTIFRDSEHTDAAHNSVELNDLAAPDGDVSFGGFKLTNLGGPAADTDAATKGYVDGVAQGLDVKQSVRVATTAAGTLASSFENGDTVDGVTLATGDRILIKNQSTGSENGIYVVAASGAPTRSADANVSAEVTSGMFVFVEEGTTNGDTGWVLTTNQPITLDSTALVFAQFSGAGAFTAGNGLTQSGTTFDVVAGSTPGSGGPGGGLVSNANDVVIDTGVVVRKYAASFGDNSATSFNIDHNLGTLDVIVQVFANSGGEQVECDVVHSTTNRVVLTFTSAPTTNQYRVVVHA